MSKGKTQASNGDVCSHLSAFKPAKTPSPIATSNCVPIPAYRIRNCLLLTDSSFLSGSGLLFITIHLHHIGPHMALTVESGRGFHL